MEEIQNREPKLITEQMKKVRVMEASIDSWTLQEVAADIESISAAILTEIPSAKNNNHGHKAAKARVRKYLLALETLGVKFRKLSV